MKPDWKDAPEWANWLAMDSDGDWLWHEFEPIAKYGVWFSEGRFELAQDYWRSQKEQRP